MNRMNHGGHKKPQPHGVWLWIRCFGYGAIYMTVREWMYVSVATLHLLLVLPYSMGNGV